MKKPYTILIMGLRWPPETFLLRLVEGLSVSGQTICISGNNRPPKAWLEKFNVDWQKTPSWNVTNITRSLNFIQLFFSLQFSNWGRLKKLALIVRKIKTIRKKIYAFYKIAPLVGIESDCVYFPWVLGADPYLEWFQCNEVPVIVSLRGSMVNVDPSNPFKGEYTKSTLRRIFELSNTIHCVSKNIFENAQQYGLKKEKTVLIRPAVDVDYFLLLKNKPLNERFTIITTGSLIWHKGYEYALMALKILIDKNIKINLHIIGDGPEIQRVLYTVEDLSIHDNVFLHGKLSPSQVRDRIQAADVFLLSSLSEGISNAALEAMSCGIPVVTTDCGGMREAIQNGIEGYIVPVRAPLEAANAIEKLVKDENLRAMMGRAGRSRVEKEFALSQQLNVWNELFSHLKDNKNI